jgi:hypothetical protein
MLIGTAPPPLLTCPSAGLLLLSLTTHTTHDTVFIMRKVLLALTDMFPIEMAMLISSLWVTNLTDMVRTTPHASPPSSNTRRSAPRRFKSISNC